MISYLDVEVKCVVAWEEEDAEENVEEAEEEHEPEQEPLQPVLIEPEHLIGMGIEPEHLIGTALIHVHAPKKLRILLKKRPLKLKTL